MILTSFAESHAPGVMRTIANSDARRPSVQLTLRRYDGARQAHDRSSPAGPFQAHG